jgi:GrpB-like predicted nucleotidyltransferase (UPF0157 family)
VNLHVRLVGSPTERLAFLFRDWFRSHPGAVPAYAAFKRCLDGISRDVNAYADVKDHVVDLVVGGRRGVGTNGRLASGPTARSLNRQ